jgi:hypothetical protein
MTTKIVTSRQAPHLYCDCLLCQSLSHFDAGRSCADAAILCASDGRPFFIALDDELRNIVRSELSCLQATPTAARDELTAKLHFKPTVLLRKFVYTFSGPKRDVDTEPRIIKVFSKTIIIKKSIVVVWSKRSNQTGKIDGRNLTSCKQSTL